MRKIGKAAALLVAAALSFGPAAWADAPTTIVKIDNFSFQPGNITVPAGTHLKFENHDDLPHTVVIPDLKMQSKMLDTDDSYEAVMEKPGKYVYFCGVHPMMKGEITVTESSAANP